jgi:subtilisin family serine protease
MFRPPFPRCRAALLLAATLCARLHAADEFIGQADFILTLRASHLRDESFAEICNLYRLTVKYFSPRHGIAAVRVALGTGYTTAAALLASDHRIAGVEPDTRVYVADVFPDDPLFARQWALHNPDNGRADIKAPEAWEMSRGRGNVVIGIIDTGIDYLHPDLQANIWRNENEVPGNGRDDDNNGYVDDVHGWDFATRSADPMDRYYHGTLMAGVVGAEADNGEGIAGVMHRVSLMAVKGLGDHGWGYSSDLIAAIYYAVDNGACVINASWGSGGYVGAMYDAIAYAARCGVVFVAAAGNWHRNNDEEPFYPASYDLDNIISVAASDSRDSLASFSHYGTKSVDIAAPGVRVISTTLDGGYHTTSGTSLAAPHVTGCVGLLNAYAPGLLYRDYVDIIVRSAEPLDQLKGLCTSGGRLDVHRALRRSASGRRDTRFALYYLSRRTQR